MNWQRILRACLVKRGAGVGIVSICLPVRGRRREVSVVLIHFYIDAFPPFCFGGLILSPSRSPAAFPAIPSHAGERKVRCLRLRDEPIFEKACIRRPIGGYDAIAQGPNWRRPSATPLRAATTTGFGQGWRMGDVGFSVSLSILPFPGPVGVT